MSVTIEFEGIEDRTVELPVAAGNYGSLAATAERVFFVSHPTVGMAEDDSWWELVPALTEKLK